MSDRIMSCFGDPIRAVRFEAWHRGGSSSARHRIVLGPDLPPLDESGADDRILFLGPDQHGVPLEVLAIELAGGELLVIHAMKLRRRYRRDYETVMAWRRRS